METTAKVTALDRIALVLAPLSVVLMEAFWGYPWLLWAGRWEILHLGGTPLSFFSILVLVAIAFLATRLLLGRAWSSAAARWTVMGLGLIVSFVIVRIEYGGGIELFSIRWFTYAGQLFANMLNNPNGIVVALPASAYFWWRGMILGRAREYTYVHDNITFGAGSYVLLALVWWATIGADSLRSMAGAIAPHVAAFFFCGLVAMALGNLRSVQKRIRPDEPRAVSFGRWLPIVLGVVTLLVLIGVLIATASSLDIAGFIRRLFGSIPGFLGTVGNYIGIAFQYIMIPFEWLASVLLMFLIYLTRLFGNKPPGQTGEPGGNLPELPEGVKPTSPEAFITLLKWALFAIAVVLVTILIVRSLERTARRKREGKPDFEETRESLWSWRRLFSDFILFFERILGRFLPGRKSAAKSGQGAFSAAHADEPITTLKIREVFRRLLRESAKAGITWHHSETPFEYARRFAETVPDASPQMSELTQLYVRVRYSAGDAGDSEVTRANSLWRHIRETLRKIKHADG